jgi:outer membrane protein OmpA-like peptidoglycan-associated protein/opacity protein-like surface antigen
MLQQRGRQTGRKTFNPRNGAPDMKRLFAVLGLGSLVATPAMAGDGGSWGHLWDDSGMYFGADVGQYTWDLDHKSLDRDVVNTLGDFGLSVVDGGSELSDDGFTWGLILGYQLFPFLAFEAAYVDLGSVEYKANATVTDGVSTGQFGTRMDVESQGAAVSGLAILPFAKHWRVFGRAGAYFGSNDSTARASLDGVEASDSGSNNSTSFLWGAGLGYARDRWTTRLEYQQYTDVGEDRGFSGVDVDRIVLSAVYRTDLGAWHGRSEPEPAPVVAAPVAAPPPPPPAPPADRDGDGIADANDQCPDTPAGENVGPFGCSCDVTVRLHYGFDSAELTPADRELLDGVAGRLNALKFVGGEVAGYTDSIGDDAYNLDLSRRRAQSALDYLASKGVAPGRMTAVGFGESKPIADNDTEEGRALNRRVVIRRTDCGASN